MKPEVTTGELANLLGISMRQVDHWVRQGYIRHPPEGSGHRRNLGSHEQRVLALMAALVQVGMLPSAAASIARSIAEIEKEAGRACDSIVIPLATREI